MFVPCTVNWYWESYSLHTLKSFPQMVIKQVLTIWIRSVICFQYFIKVYTWCSCDPLEEIEHRSGETHSFTTVPLPVSAMAHVNNTLCKCQWQRKDLLSLQESSTAPRIILTQSSHTTSHTGCLSTLFFSKHVHAPHCKKLLTKQLQHSVRALKLQNNTYSEHY